MEISLLKFWKPSTSVFKSENGLRHSIPISAAVLLTMGTLQSILICIEEFSKAVLSAFDILKSSPQIAI